MKLTLLPLQNDDVIRVRCDGALTLRQQETQADPLQSLLGPHCYSHKVLLNLERSQGIDTSGICWLLRNHNSFAQSRGAFVLYAVPPAVTDILDFLQLRPQLHIADAEPDARQLALGHVAAGAAGPDGNGHSNP
jgi:anti-anti-sigma regulatory factor